MCNSMLAALLGLAAGCGVPPAPAGSLGPPSRLGLLAPDDPRNASIFHPPAAPTAGLKRYAPVEARSDWGGAPASPSGTAPAGNGMPGMGSGKSMPSMPGMGGQ